MNEKLVVIKGAGDLATGTAHRLFRCGFRVVMLEKAGPAAIRRPVCFAQAVFSGIHTVEGVTSELSAEPERAEEAAKSGRVPVIIDPLWLSVRQLRPDVVVDAVMAKRNLGTVIDEAPVVIGLGPGFTAGADVHAVVETCRGHDLGRVILSGSAAPNTGAPGEIGGYSGERVVRSPGKGILISFREIGDPVEKGEIIGAVGGRNLVAPLSGVLRGMLKSGLEAVEGMKVGDIDLRCLRDSCFSISDKSRVVAGGVVKAIMRLTVGRAAIG